MQQALWDGEDCKLIQKVAIWEEPGDISPSCLAHGKDPARLVHSVLGLHSVLPILVATS